MNKLITLTNFPDVYKKYVKFEYFGQRQNQLYSLLFRTITNNSNLYIRKGVMNINILCRNQIVHILKLYFFITVLIITNLKNNFFFKFWRSKDEVLHY